ncbi:ionic transporter y4hA [Bdellovibrio sp. qaytius]|nr:ionic transporter y4hA [Bdellovibrio sp. qaytius]
MNRYFDTTQFLSLASVFIMLVVYSLGTSSAFVLAIAIAFLGVAVMTAVHHAEVIALRVGPSLGALILALSVTVIEVGLIVSLMTNDTPDSAVVARDTVFSALIIVTNGIVGVCLLLGGLRFRELDFHVQGASSLLGILAVLAGITMVLPNYTTSTAGSTYSSGQLIFVSCACLLLYALLVFFQTKTHKDYFEVTEVPTEDTVTPSLKRSVLSFICLVLSLGAVIGLAKSLSPSIEAGVAALHAPRAAVGIVIALLVLLPETWAAITAARANQLQTSLNLALGSGAASIALTIPVVAAFSIMTNRTLTLGLDPKGTAFLLMTFMVGGLTLGTGRTTALQGATHLVLMLAYLVMSFIP